MFAGLHSLTHELSGCSGTKKVDKNQMMNAWRTRHDALHIGYQ